MAYLTKKLTPSQLSKLAKGVSDEIEILRVDSDNYDLEMYEIFAQNDKSLYDLAIRQLNANPPKMDNVAPIDTPPAPKPKAEKPKTDPTYSNGDIIKVGDYVTFENKGSSGREAATVIGFMPNGNVRVEKNDGEKTIAATKTLQFQAATKPEDASKPKTSKKLGRKPYEGKKRTLSYKNALPADMLENAEDVVPTCDFMVVTLTEPVTITTLQNGEIGDKALFLKDSNQPVAILEKSGTVAKSLQPRNAKKATSPAASDDDESNEKDEKVATPTQIDELNERMEELVKESNNRDTSKNTKKQVVAAVKEVKEILADAQKDDNDKVTKGDIKAGHKIIAKFEDGVANDANENEGKSVKKRPNRRNCNIKGVTRETAPLITYIEKSVTDYFDKDEDRKLHRILRLKDNVVIAEFRNILGFVTTWEKVCLKGNDAENVKEPAEKDVEEVLFATRQLTKLYKVDSETYKTCSDTVKKLYQKCVKDGTCYAEEIGFFARQANNCQYWVKTRLLNGQYVTYLHSEAKKRYKSGSGYSKAEKAAAKEKYGSYRAAWEEVRLEWRKKYMTDHKLRKNEAKFGRKKETI